MNKPLLIIKVGGGRDVHWENVSKDLVQYIPQHRVLIVHGANAKRDEIATLMSTPTKHITSPSGISSVYTDDSALNTMLMAYPGVVNSRAVAILLAHGIPAVGLSGIDGSLWIAKQKKAVYAYENGKTMLVSDNLTGKVESINTDLLALLMDAGYVPVLCAPAVDVKGQILNTNNDWPTALMAVQLHAKSVLFLFESPGFLLNHGDESTVVPHMDTQTLESLSTSAKGGMKQKLMAITHIVKNSSTSVYLSDGRIDEPITKALQHYGTTINT